MLNTNKLQEKILMYIFAGTAIFVIIALAFDFAGSSTETFEATLQDSNTVDVIIITSSPYNEKTWKKIKKIVTTEAAKTSDVKKLNQDVLLILSHEGYAVVALNITRQIVNVFVSDVLQNG